MEDTSDLKSDDLLGRAGSSPALGTNLLNSFNGRTSAFQADDDGSIPLFSSTIKYSFGSQVVRQWSATPRSWVQISYKTPICRCSLMVEHYLAKVIVGVRFSSLAPFGNSLTGSGVIINSGRWPQDYWAGWKLLVHQRWDKVPSRRVV